MTWGQLLGPRATFQVASWRTHSLQDVREELERALDVEFIVSKDKVYDGETAFASAVPACELRLNCWTAPSPAFGYVNFIGLPAADPTHSLLPAENLSQALSEYLREAGCDWYVPHVNEGLESGGVLGDELLDPEVIVSMLAPRWLAWTTGEETDVGTDLLGGIAQSWVTAARRTTDPVSDVRRRRAEFEGWSEYVPPRSRFRVLGNYAVQEPLSDIDEQLADLRELTPEELALRPEIHRLEEWRAVVESLTEASRWTGVESIERHREALAILLGKLLASVRRPEP